MSVIALVATGKLDETLAVNTKRSSKTVLLNDESVSEVKDNIETITIVKQYDLMENFYISHEDYDKIEYVELVIDDKIIQKFSGKMLKVYQLLGNNFLPFPQLNILNLAMYKVLINIKYFEPNQKINVYAYVSYCDIEEKKFLQKNSKTPFNSFQELKVVIPAGETNIKIPTQFKFLCKKIAFTFGDCENNIFKKGKLQFSGIDVFYFSEYTSYKIDKLLNNNIVPKESIYTHTFDNGENKDINKMTNFSRIDSKIFKFEINEQKEDVECSIYYFGLNIFENGKLLFKE